MSKLFSRRRLAIGAFGVITVALGLSIGRDIRQYMDNPKTPQEPLDTPLVTGHPLTKAQETHTDRPPKTDIASLQEQQSMLQRERDDLAKKISLLEQRIAANKK